MDFEAFGSIKLCKAIVVNVGIAASKDPYSFKLIYSINHQTNEFKISSNSDESRTVTNTKIDLNLIISSVSGHQTQFIIKISSPVNNFTLISFSAL